MFEQQPAAGRLPKTPAQGVRGGKKHNQPIGRHPGGARQYPEGHVGQKNRRGGVQQYSSEHILLPPFGAKFKPDEGVEDAKRWGAGVHAWGCSNIAIIGSGWAAGTGGTGGIGETGGREEREESEKLEESEERVESEGRQRRQGREERWESEKLEE